MVRLAIIVTHPIQYYAPLFQLLAAKPELQLRVFYTWGEESIIKYDPGFKRNIAWDIPLLDGYDYEFLLNTAIDKGSHHFAGIVNPTATRRISEFNPDIILVFGWSNKSHLSIMRFFSKKKAIWFRGDSTLLDEKSGLKKLAKKYFLQWVYSHVDRAFYVGSNNKEYFLKYGLKNDQLTFAPHAIDNARFHSVELNESARQRALFGIKEDDILILFAGKFESKKDPLLLLEAFKSLNNPKTHLLYVGNGPLEETLKHMASGFNDKIHFMQFQNQQEMPSIYHSCDLFCLPSKGPGETWGLAINEAMASGKAILASDKVGCARDLVHKGVNGYIFKATSYMDLKKKLESLCDLPKLVAYGKKSKEIIDSWSYEAIIKAFVNNI